MKEPKKLHELTEKEFNALKKAGLLKTIYPDCDVDDFKKIMPHPIPDAQIDWSEVISQAKKHFENSLKDEVDHEDDEHYMYEAVMQAVYGKDVFDFLNAINSDN